MCPAGQEVGRRGLEFPGRASGQQKSETTGIGVIQILDLIQEGRHLLDLIHAYGRRAPAFCFKDLREDMRVALQFQPRSAFLEVEDPGICVRNPLEQCGFPGLPSPEEQADLVVRGLGLQYAFNQSRITDHNPYNIPDNLHVNTKFAFVVPVNRIGDCVGRWSDQCKWLIKGHKGGGPINNLQVIV